MKPEEWRPIVSNGLRESRPYKPLGMKRIGEVQQIFKKIYKPILVNSEY